MSDITFNNAPGTVFTDGTVQWTVKQAANTQSISGVNNRIDTVNSIAGRGIEVTLGQTAMLEGMPINMYLECTTGGTTGATAPVITTVTEGQTISDGSVVWTVRKCTPMSITRDIKTQIGNIFRYELFGQLQNGTKSYPLVVGRAYLVVCAHPLATSNGLYLVSETETTAISKFVSGASNISPTITKSDGVLTITIGNRAMDYTVYCVGIAN